MTVTMERPADQRLVHVCLFGMLRLDIDGSSLDPRALGGRKPRQVLELLLLRGGHLVTAAELAGRLWGDRPPPDAGATLQHYVSVLRRRLRVPAPWLSDLIVTERAGYRMDTRLLRLDLTEFDEVVDALADRNRRGGPDRVAMDRALALVTGEILAGERADAWVKGARDRYGRRHAQLALAAGAAALAAGDGRRAVEIARLVVDLPAASEAHSCLLMAAYYLLGDRPAALASFEACQQRLSDELGVDPLPAARDLHQVVCRGGSVDAVVAAVLRQCCSGSTLARSA